MYIIYVYIYISIPHEKLLRIQHVSNPSTGN